MADQLLARLISLLGTSQMAAMVGAGYSRASELPARPWPWRGSDPTGPRLRWCNLCSAKAPKPCAWRLPAPDAMALAEPTTRLYREASFERDSVTPPVPCAAPGRCGCTLNQSLCTRLVRANSVPAQRPVASGPPRSLQAREPLGGLCKSGGTCPAP